MARPRLIDADERVRTRPMRVLVLGMCRTGTTTVSLALRKLGYTPHAMRDVLVNPSQIALWQEAVATTILPPSKRSETQRNLPPYGRVEFDKLLGHYDVVADLPGIAFARQLVEAYPEANVILTNLDYEDWEKSMQNTLWRLFTWKLFVLCRILNLSQMAPVVRLLHPIFTAHNGNHYGGPVAREAYDRHYNDVRSIVPKEKLLEIGPEFEWDPLCQFLQHDVPKEPFPRIDESRGFEAQLLKTWWRMAQYLALMVLFPIGATAIATFLYYRQEQVYTWYGDVIKPYKGFLSLPK